MLFTRACPVVHTSPPVAAAYRESIPAAQFQTASLAEELLSLREEFVTFWDFLNEK